MQSTLAVKIALELLCFLWLMFCVVLFYRHREEHYFRGRRPEFSLAFLLLSSVGNICWIATITSELLGPEVDAKIRPPIVAVLTVTFAVFAATVLLRVYFLHYDHRYSDAMLSTSWSDALELADPNWYIEKIHTYGSTRFVGAPLVLLFVLLSVPSVIEIIAGIDMKYTDQIGRFLTGTICIGGALVCLWKLRSHYWDNIFLLHETILLISSMFLGVIFVLMNFWCPVGSAYAVHSSCFVKLVCLALIYVILSGSSSAFVIAAMKWRQMVNDRTSRRPISRENLSSWTTLIQDRHTYDLFAQFLVGEFAVESLLFLTEYMQFKMEYKKDILDLGEVKDKGFVIGLPRHLTRPTYGEKLRRKVEDMDIRLTDIQKCGMWIYEKYIQAGTAPQEINVSWPSRRRAMEIFEPKQEGFSLSTLMPRLSTGTPLDEMKRIIVPQDDDIIHVLDACAVEISSLLRGAFIRFERTCCPELETIRSVSLV